MLNSITIIFRVVSSYIVIFVTFRLMGKRAVGDLNVIDLIVFLMIAEISAIAIVSLDRPYFHFLLASLIILFLQKGITYIKFKNHDMRHLAEIAPSVIIANGKLNYYEMRKTHFTFDRLMMELRKQGIRSISEVDFAIIESAGNVSIFKKNEGPFISPLPLVLAGEMIKENFKYVDIDEMDFKTLLHNRGFKQIEDVLYANYEENELFIISREDGERQSLM